MREEELPQNDGADAEDWLERPQEKGTKSIAPKIKQ